jgi:hypothetical protein
MAPRGNSIEQRELQSLVHNLMEIAKQTKQKQDEKKEQCRKDLGVDLVGADLIWTEEEKKVVSIKEMQTWDMYGLVCFVWAHLSKNLEYMDDDTYVRELAEVWRLMRVFHHKMRTNDTRSICIVPSHLDVEDRIHFLTKQDISAVHKKHFNALVRPRHPPYVSDCDDKHDTSVSSSGTTTDESF